MTIHARSTNGIVISVMAVAFVLTTLVVGFWIYPLSVIAMICIYAGALATVIYFYNRAPRLSSVILAMFLLTLVVDAVFFVFGTHPLSAPVRVLTGIGAVGAFIALFYTVTVIRRLGAS